MRYALRVKSAKKMSEKCPNQLLFQRALAPAKYLGNNPLSLGLIKEESVWKFKSHSRIDTA